MRVKFDENLCVGSGQCELAVPTVFAVGDEGVVEVDEAAVGDAPEDKLRQAVRDCPTQALSLVE